jgi:hypothetical protein
MPVMKLTYFDLRARAEPARLILAQVFHFSNSAPSSFWPGYSIFLTVFLLVSVFITK